MSRRAWVVPCLVVGMLSTAKAQTPPSPGPVAYGEDFEGYVATISLTDALNVGVQYKRSGRNFFAGFFTELGLGLMDLGVLYAAGHRRDVGLLAAASTLAHGFHESYYENVFSRDPAIRARPLTSRFVLPVAMFRMEFARGTRPSLYLPMENLFIASYAVAAKDGYGSARLDWKNSLLSGSWVFSSRQAIVDEDGALLYGSNFYPAPVSVYRAGTKEETETVLHEAFVHVRQGDWSRRVFRALTYRKDPDAPRYESLFGTRDYLTTGPLRFGARLDKTALHAMWFGRLTAGVFDDAREQMAYGFTDDCRDSELNPVPCR